MDVVKRWSVGFFVYGRPRILKVEVTTILNCCTGKGGGGCGGDREWGASCKWRNGMNLTWYLVWIDFFGILR